LSIPPAGEEKGRAFPTHPELAPRQLYRNPVIYAHELQQEMVRDGLTRKQIAERHRVSSDRITQWLCLLKLPEEILSEIESLGDYWDRKAVTERELRSARRLQLHDPDGVPPCRTEHHGR
jgi:hypothetical protein